jgi:mono/diheme cytochrome c family protein
MRKCLKTGYFSIVRLAIMALVIASGTGSATAQQTPVEPKMDGQLMLGKSAFTRFCAECHGPMGQGTDKGPTFIHRVYHPGHHGDGAFFIAAKKGARQHHWKFGNMKPVKGVTDAQLGKIVKYVRALQKANGLF